MQNKTNTTKTYKRIILEPRLRITDLVEAQEIIHTKNVNIIWFKLTKR